jgi:hypothetical protein
MCINDIHAAKLNLVDIPNVGGLFAWDDSLSGIEPSYINGALKLEYFAVRV